MTVVNVPEFPNVKFTFREGEHSFVITIRTIKGITLFSVSDENGDLSNSTRAITGQWLIPYKHISSNGNFRFESENSEEYPYYTGFNKDFNLVYYTEDEVKEIGW